MTLNRISLPFGNFQVHFAASSVKKELPGLEEALAEHHALLDRAYGQAPEVTPAEGLARHLPELQKSADRVVDASRRFYEALEVSEFPAQLPTMTKQLVVSSIIVEALELVFEVTDYRREKQRENVEQWQVTGTITDQFGQQHVVSAQSFEFESAHDWAASAALLTACAEVFIECVAWAAPDYREGADSES